MVSTEPTVSRRIRGQQLLVKREPECIGNDCYLMHSQSSDREYIVKNLDYRWTCECPDFEYRKLNCKHIFAVKFWLSLREKINQKEDFELLKPTESLKSCPFCKSENLIKRGIRKTYAGNKQRLQCKACNKKFVLDPFKKLKGDGKAVTLVMDLYFKGISLRKIQDHLKQFYNLEIHHETIRRWINRFVYLINNYVDKLEPQLGKTWHADEQMVKSNGKYIYSWNLLDSDTRFLIANNITKGRYVKDARKVFEKAKQITDTKPKEIVTDGLWSYEKAIKKEMKSWKYPQTKHIRNAGISKENHNNPVERYHSTFRERDKVIRGFKGLENTQKWTNGFRVYYNFVRPHQALDGHTPSEVAGINLDLNGNKWLGLIKHSIENNGKKIEKHKVGSFIVKVSKDNIEIDPKKLGIRKVKFENYDKAVEFVEFYKQVRPDYSFSIENLLIDKNNV